MVNDRIQNLTRRQVVRDVFARRFRWDEERFGQPIDCPTFTLDTSALAAFICDESLLECRVRATRKERVRSEKRTFRKAVPSTKTRRNLRRLAGRRLLVLFHTFVSPQKASPACGGVCRVRETYAASRGGCLDSPSLARKNALRIFMTCVPSWIMASSLANSFILSM